MTANELIAAGYSECQGPGPWTNVDCFWHRCIRLGQDKLYFINVGMWDNRRFDSRAGIGWEAEGYFYRAEDRSYRLRIPVEEHDTIGDIEAEFSDFYVRMNCVPDIHNQD
jgi:hypothetical protein